MVETGDKTQREGVEGLGLGGLAAELIGRQTSGGKRAEDHLDAKGDASVVRPKGVINLT